MLELKAKTRTELGKKAKALRRADFLPAVLYGEGVPAQSITVPYKDFSKLYKEVGETSILKLDVDGKPYNVLIYDVVPDPIKGKILHADFYAVRMDRVIRAKIPMEFFGESPAVKNENGILLKVMQELEVEAFPQDLPREIRVDLGLLENLESRFLVKDIPIPKGVKILVEPDEVVVLVQAPKVEEVVVEAAPAPEVTEVKTEREVKTELKKKEEEEAQE